MKVVGIKIKYQKSKLIFCMVVIIVIIFTLGTQFSFHRMQGLSMTPTFKNGDIVLLKKQQIVHRYDVVAFKEKHKSYIKRVIGLPKDSFILQGNQLTISLGSNRFRSVVTFEIQPQLSSELKGKTQIPNGYYLMIGDASDISKDSRDFGLIEKTQIEGKIIWKS